MYCHKKIYELRYTDVDFEDRLKLSSLLSFMEESACLSADELGFGYSVVQPKNYGFILINWHIELFEEIKLGQKLEIHTWPIKPKMTTVFRDFELYVDGGKVGVAVARWCLIDLATFNILPAALAIDGSITFNENRAATVTNWKIPALQGGEKLYSKAVTYSDYDHYNHVNNTKYADFLMDVFAPQELKGKYAKNVRITYVKQSKCGETLDFYRQRQDDGSWIIEGRCEGELRVQMQVAFNE